jgi:hypothetical protein
MGLRTLAPLQVTTTLPVPGRVVSMAMSKWLWLTFRAAAGATSFGDASIGLKYKMGDAGRATQR